MVSLNILVDLTWNIINPFICNNSSVFMLFLRPFFFLVYEQDG